MDQQLCAQFSEKCVEDGTNFVDSTNTDAITELKNIPEDCLLEIFSQTTLDLMDLCCLAETCKLFRPITQRVIGKKLNVFVFDFRPIFESEELIYDNATPSDTEKLFTNFGPCFSRVSISTTNRRLQFFLLNLLMNHCDEELKHLNFQNFQISASLAERLEPVFRRLHTFTLKKFSIDGNMSLFSRLDSLVKLELSEVRNCSLILENVFPQLEQFSYRNCEAIYDFYHDDPYFVTLKTFIASHTTLTSLDISLRCFERSWWMKIILAIGNGCTHLQKLKLHNSFETAEYLSISLQPLQALKSLTSLELYSVSLEDFKVLASLTELRALILRKCLLPIFDQFPCLPQLAELLVVQCRSSSSGDVTHIIQQLVNLEKLELDFIFNNNNFILDEKTFSKIVALVKGRPNVLDLSCRCVDHINIYFKNQNVKL